MKSKKIHFTSLIFLLAFNTLIAQNPMWSLPQGQYSEIGGYLPLPTPTPIGTINPGYFYSGAAATNTHNAMSDGAGNLLFFIVDNWVYDKNGYGLMRLHFTDSWDNNSSNVRGNSDVCIVPDPGNCSRYYIFTTTYGFQTNNTAVYALLDLSLPHTVIP